MHAVTLMHQQLARITKHDGNDGNLPSLGCPTAGNAMNSLHTSKAQTPTSKKCAPMKNSSRPSITFTTAQRLNMSHDNTLEACMKKIVCASSATQWPEAVNSRSEHHRLQHTSRCFDKRKIICDSSVGQQP